MDKRLRQIIKEEVYRVMQEIGEDPVKMAGDMLASSEEQLKQLQDELKFREADTRVTNIPKQEKVARLARAKELKDRIEIAKQEVEMAKQAQVNAIQFAQLQQNQNAENPEAQQTQDQAQTQI